MTEQSTAVATIERQPRSVLVDMSTRYGMEPAAFEATLRATVCKGNVGREEFAAFLLVAKEYRLNPLTKEIYAFPAKGGGIQPIVSIDGWCRIINEHPALDGIEFDDVLVEGKLEAVTCRIYRKDRDRPTAVTEYMSECRRSTDTWKTWPARMLRHKALIQCARYAFGFSGIVDPDEYERQMTVRDITREGPNLAARLNAPSDDDGPKEGFTTVNHPLGDDDIPDFPRGEPADDSAEDPAPATDGDDPSQAGADDTFPGDKPSAGESEAAEPTQQEENTGSAATVMDRVDQVIADFAFKSLAELKTVQADRKFAAFLAAVRGQDPDAADRVEKALKDALGAFGQ